MAHLRVRVPMMTPCPHCGAGMERRNTELFGIAYAEWTCHTVTVRVGPEGEYEQRCYGTAHVPLAWIGDWSVEGGE